MEQSNSHSASSTLTSEEAILLLIQNLLSSVFQYGYTDYTTPTRTVNQIMHTN